MYGRAPIDDACECGHKKHDKRCSPGLLPTCPCREYTPAEEKTSPGLNADYYQKARDGE